MSDFTNQENEAATLFAETIYSADIAMLETMAAEGKIKEICDEEENSNR